MKENWAVLFQLLIWRLFKQMEECSGDCIRFCNNQQFPFFAKNICFVECRLANISWKKWNTRLTPTQDLLIFWQSTKPQIWSKLLINYSKEKFIVCLLLMKIKFQLELLPFVKFFKNFWMCNLPVRFASCVHFFFFNSWKRVPELMYSSTR